MKSIVIDAGPLIGLFYARDSRHSECINGFHQLNSTKILQIVPLPIVFEVYKWLLQHTYPAVAQDALRSMVDSFYLEYLDEEKFGPLQEGVAKLPDWNGSLEDATIMLTALRHQCPVWTLDYRDLGSFKSLKFWNPNAK